MASFWYAGFTPSLPEIPSDEEIVRETHRVLDLLDARRCDVWVYRGPESHPISGATDKTSIRYGLPVGTGRPWLGALIAHECAHVVSPNVWDHGDEWRAHFLRAMRLAYGITFVDYAWSGETGVDTTRFARVLARSGW